MVRACLSWLLCLIFLTGMVSAESFSGPKKYPMDKSSSSYLLAKQYPISDIRLDFVVNFKKPGRIFDTVGINVAPIGSWAIFISGEGVISVHIYDPKRKSDKQTSNGWHVLSSSYGVMKQSAHRIVVVMAKGIVYLKVGEKPADILALDTPLSGEPIYVGDYPGDDSWGTRYNIHPAMVGTVIVNSFGPITENTPIVDTSKPTDTNTETVVETVPTKEDDKTQPVPRNAPSDTPEAVNAGVKVIEDALAARDVDKVKALIAGDARETLGEMLSNHQEDLPKLSALLATRKLTVVSGSYAEFEVTEGEKTFTAIFYKIKGQWRLASL